MRPPEPDAGATASAPPAPRVSVCIPTYRGAATLGPAIESVLAQRFGDFELVIVDDQSPDDTAAVVARYADPRIRYHRNERNLGPQGNWNRCLALARGTYFKLLPHDDLLHPDCLLKQVAVLDADADARLALVFCARDVLGPDGRVLAARGYRGAPEGRLAARALMRACVHRGTNVIGEPGAVLCRRALSERIGGFDARQPYVIDLDHWFRLLCHGDAWHQTRRLASFRVSAQQWSVALSRQQSQDFNAFIERIAPQVGLRLGRLDRARSRGMAALNNLLRRVFYRVFLRPEAGARGHGRAS